MPKIDLIQADSRSIPLADKSVQCVVTSPPYYALRLYSGGDKQIGLEETLQEYIDNLVLVFDEVWRVLRDDGTVWLNLGDSYASGSPCNRQSKIGLGSPGKETIRTSRLSANLKEKDLMLVPHRVAIALQDRGWWVRSDIVWHKPNPMPESARDRPTKAHEYIFLLSKNKKYYYDADAIREPNKWEHVGEKRYTSEQSKNGGSVETPVIGKGNTTGSFRQFNPGGRNKRSVWSMSTRGYSGGHFATFPPELPETCIKAGTSEAGECAECGAPLVRNVKAEGGTIGSSWHDHKDDLITGHNQGNNRAASRGWETDYKRVDLGFEKLCNCETDQVRPQIVLDPFGGTATTAIEANKLGRRGIALDLSWEYLGLAKERAGLTALEAWGTGKKAESNLSDLPMFEGVE